MATDHVRLRELFVAACDLPAQQQIALMDEKCADDPTLRMELEQLLRQDGSADGILADAGLTAGLQLNVDTLLEVELPEKIGRYRVKRVLGKGGMGVVYLAQQENPQRDVAVKVIRPGIMNRELLRRFEFEAAVLGRLQHPGIAKIHEAGMYVDGSGRRPFFAMDYVKGQPLNEYIQQNVPRLTDRMKMFVQICNAVHHAHQRGVIHRDLKPGNILVTADGQTHILDFGVARATETDLQLTTMETSAGQLIGTLPYMSPEQISARADDIDTRSDVYSLGVVLYELLVGRNPYDLNQLSVPDAIQKVKQDSPERISRWDKNLRGDIETIVNKSLEKDKKLRYQSASELAADINRYLNQLPIEARPASTVYQMRKFAGRNKGLVASACIILATLLTSAILIARYSARQTIALQEAKRQILIKDEVNDFLNKDLLGKANPYVTGKKNITVRELLHAASDKIDGRFEGMPQVEADVRLTLGQSFAGLAEYKQAQPHLEIASSLFETELGRDSPRTIAAKTQLVKCLIEQWKLDEAESLCKEVLDSAEFIQDISPKSTANSYELYAVVLNRRGKFADAETYYRKAIALWDQSEEVEVRGYRNVARHNLANTLKDQKKLDESEALFREVVTERKELFTKDHPLTCTGIQNLANVLWKQSLRKDLDVEIRQLKLDEAEDLFNEVFSIRLKSLGETHPHTIGSLYGTALIKESRKEYEAAEKIFQRSLELYRKAHKTDEHMDVLNAMNGIGTSRVNMGRAEDAIPMFELALVASLKMVGPDNYKTKIYVSNLLHCYHDCLKDDVGLSEFYDRFRDQLSFNDRARTLKILAGTLAHNLKMVQAIGVQTRLCDLLFESEAKPASKAAAFRSLAGYLKEMELHDEAEQAANKARELEKLIDPK